MMVVCPRTLALSVVWTACENGGRSHAQSASSAPAIANAATSRVKRQPRLGGAQPRDGAAPGATGASLASRTSTGSFRRSCDSAGAETSSGLSFSAIALRVPHLLKRGEFAGQRVDAVDPV